MKILNLRRLEKERWERRLISAGKRRRRRMQLQAWAKLIKHRTWKAKQKPIEKVKAPTILLEKTPTRPSLLSLIKLFLKRFFSQWRERRAK